MTPRFRRYPPGPSERASEARELRQSDAALSERTQRFSKTTGRNTKGLSWDHSRLSPSVLWWAIPDSN